MKTSAFDYHLPKHLIAQKPASQRDHARLLVLDKKSGKMSHHYFYELPDLLRPDDVLVFNNSKVFKARLWGRKETSGKIEVFLLRAVKPNTWEVLIGGRGGHVGQIINFGKKLSGQIIEKQNSIRLMRFNLVGKKLDDEIDRLGAVPLPPYIKCSAPLEKYQTIYAKTRGSVAAPTAGLHFTNRLLSQLRKKGVRLEYVTLHVGLGTFQSIQTENIEDHKIHGEWASIDAATVRRLNQYKRQRRRIIAVGTTMVRTLEAYSLSSQRRGLGEVRSTKFSSPNPHPTLSLERRGNVNLYITPGYKFKFTDAMITNFHLPQSSLLVMVSAFIGHDKIMAAYQTAIKKKYRFYSFGDAMLIL